MSTNREQNVLRVLDVLRKIGVYIHNGYRVEWDGEEITGVRYSETPMRALIEHGPNCSTIILDGGDFEDLADEADLDSALKRFTVSKMVEDAL